ncbi:MAG: MFS transporter [Proteobacteria bacterium]|nr:MFS transporter [Pseudomonadota bacterium]
MMMVSRTAWTITNPVGSRYCGRNVNMNTAITNPKMAVFMLTFLPQYLDPTGFVIVQAVLLTIIMAIVNIVWLSLYVFALGFVAPVLRRPRVRRFQEGALPRVVTRAQITAAQAFNQASNGVATVLGPALGATIIGLGATTPAGAAYGYSFDTMTYAFSMIALVSVATRLQAPRAATGPNGRTGLGRLRADIAEGLRYLWNDPDLQGMMAMNFVHRMLLGSLVLGAIVLAQSTLKASTQEIGWVLTAGGGGSLVAAFVATRLRARFAIWPLMIVVVFANAAGFAILAGAPHIFVAMAGMAVATFCESLTGIVQVAFRLAAIPDALQGRVNSAYRWVAYTGMTVGAAGGGFMLDHLGPRSALAIAAGAMGGLGVAVLGLRARRTRTHPPAIATG